MHKPESLSVLDSSYGTSGHSAFGLPALSVSGEMDKTELEGSVSFLCFLYVPSLGHDGNKGEGVFSDER